MTQPMLFSPLEIRGMRLKNRVVVAPMHQYSAVEGFATDWHLVNAGRYAVGGAGLVMMESTKVARSGCGTVGDTALWDDKFIPALARCAAFIKKHGAVAGIQLGHSGRKARLTPALGGRQAAEGRRARDLRLAGLGAGGAQRRAPRRARADAAGAVAQRGARSRGQVGRGGGARAARPASTWSRSTPRTATSSTSSSRPPPTSAPMPTAARR